MAKQSKIISDKNNGKGVTATALDHIMNLTSNVISEVMNKKEEHPDGCQCIDCIGQLFGDRQDVIDRGKIGVSASDKQKEILKRSLEKDEEIIAEAERLTNKIDEKQINLLLQKSLVYTTAGGIVVLALNIIIRAIIFPNLAAICGSVIGILVFAVINERIK